MELLYAAFGYLVLCISTCVPGPMFIQSAGSILQCFFLVTGTQAASYQGRYLTYSSTTVSWNTAYATCSTSGGHLLTVDNNVTINALNYIRAQPVAAAISIDIWMGLHNTETTSDVPVYVWADCKHLDDNTAIWYPGEPNIVKLHRCIITSPEYEWKTRDCTETHAFFCENAFKNDCTFETADGQTCEMGGVLLKSEMENDACAARCQEDMDGSDICWAYEYNTQSKQCKLLFGSDPYMCETLQANKGYVTGRRRCFKFSDITGSEVKGDYFPTCNKIEVTASQTTSITTTSDNTPYITTTTVAATRYTSTKASATQDTTTTTSPSLETTTTTSATTTSDTTSTPETTRDTTMTSTTFEASATSAASTPDTTATAETFETTFSAPDKTITTSSPLDGKATSQATDTVIASTASSPTTETIPSTATTATRDTDTPTSTPDTTTSAPTTSTPETTRDTTLTSTTFEASATSAASTPDTTATAETLETTFSAPDKTTTTSSSLDGKATPQATDTIIASTASSTTTETIPSTATTATRDTDTPTSTPDTSTAASSGNSTGGVYTPSLTTYLSRLEATLASSTSASSPAVASLGRYVYEVCVSVQTFTAAERKKRTDDMVDDLSLDKKNLSSYRRKKSSAEDERPSAQHVGGGVAIMLLVTAALIIILPDCTSILMHAVHGFKKKQLVAAQQ